MAPQDPLLTSASSIVVKCVVAIQTASTSPGCNSLLAHYLLLRSVLIAWFEAKSLLLPSLSLQTSRTLWAGLTVPSKSDLLRRTLCGLQFCPSCGELRVGREDACGLRRKARRTQAVTAPRGVAGYTIISIHTQRHRFKHSYPTAASTTPPSPRPSQQKAASGRCSSVAGSHPASSLTPHSWIQASVPSCLVHRHLHPGSLLLLYQLHSTPGPRSRSSLGPTAAAGKGPDGSHAGGRESVALHAAAEAD